MIEVFTIYKLYYYNYKIISFARASKLTMTIIMTTVTGITGIHDL